MAPQVTSLDDLILDEEEGSILVGFMDENEVFHFGKVDDPQDDIFLEQAMAVLKPIPDDPIFPEWPLAKADSEVTLYAAPDPLPENVYIKRPGLGSYNLLHKNGWEEQMSDSLVTEARALTELMRDPHQNLIGYHGCRVVRGRLTGIVLDKHPYDLQDHVKDGHQPTIDRDSFMTALESVLDHLHQRGWAHNDLQPRNVLVGEDGRPVLIDFEGCQKIGEELKHIRGNKDWIEGELKDHNVSEVRHDTFALEKIRAWLEEALSSSKQGAEGKRKSPGCILSLTAPFRGLQSKLRENE